MSDHNQHRTLLAVHDLHQNQSYNHSVRFSKGCAAGSSSLCADGRLGYFTVFGFGGDTCLLNKSNNWMSRMVNGIWCEPFITHPVRSLTHVTQEM
jgi:hypothetical protein